MCVVDTKIIYNIEELEEIRSSWIVLENNAEFKTIFTSYDWVHTWVRFYTAHIHKLTIITYWNDGLLVCALPLYINKKDLKTACFISSFEPVEIETCSEAQDFLSLSPSLSSGILADKIRVLMKQENLSFVKLSNVSPNALLLRVLECEKLLSVSEIIRYRYSISIPAGAARLLEKTKRIRNSAKRSGMVLCEVTNELELDGVFSALISLNKQRWVKKGFNAIFDSVVFRDFHSSVSAKLLASGKLSMLYLRKDGEVFAVNYGMRSSNSIIFYQSGFDETIKPNVSPGKLLHSAQALKAQEENLANYDLMSSPIGETYKSTLSSYSEPVLKVTVHASRLDYTITKLKISAKKMKRFFFNND